MAGLLKMAESAFDSVFIDSFRSERMELVQLLIPVEAAHETISELGKVGMLQFKDLNVDKTAFQRTYVNQVKRCDEMQRRLRFFAEQMKKAGVTPAPHAEAKPPELDELETKLETLEKELLESCANTDKLQRAHSELVELELVLEKAAKFFEGRPGTTGGPGAAGSLGAPLLGTNEKGMRLGFVAGTLVQEKAVSFERVLFRATRGNMFLRQSRIDGKVIDPALGEKVEKTVFMVFYNGERARAKILKICESYGANIYPFPEDLGRQRLLSAEVTARLRELGATLEASNSQSRASLTAIGYTHAAWTTHVKQQKAVYHTLNMLSVDVSRHSLVAEAWCPRNARPLVDQAIRDAAHRCSAQMEAIIHAIKPKEMPPTYFATNKVTSCVQDIIDAYGMARYREVNPAVFSIVTFPFLFAVMFGDVGHGVLMLLAVSVLIANEKKLAAGPLNEIVAMAFAGRYLILLMSLFSIYVGFMYNECFSIPMSVFGSTAYGCQEMDEVTGQPKPIWGGNCTSAYASGVHYLPDRPQYPIGLDPMWHGTATELPFVNSMKMKMSIIFGVTHMMLGIFMSFLNQKYFKDTLSTICEFIPQVLFLGSLFGYMSLLIIGKWIGGTREQPVQADLFHIMIYMFLSPGDVDCRGDTPDGHPGCPENVLYAGQSGIQKFLVFIVLICVPWMLIPKPYVLLQRHKKEQAGQVYSQMDTVLAAAGDDEGDRTNLTRGMASSTAAHGRARPGAPDSDEEGGARHGVSHPGPSLHGDDHDEGEHFGGGHGEFEFSEVAVHQMIHTIEFALGAVSNTASYLRLWALSLAHAQLSAVFYERVLLAGMKSGSVIGLTIGFAVWWAATVAILMGMESLSAFLHAMRLHWVEFMNKFYAGSGYKFSPFSFETLDVEEES